MSIEEKKIEPNGKLTDNFDKAQELGQKITELTNSIKTLIKVEQNPSDDEDEFNLKSQ